jgi:hypothetical protein
MAMYFLGGRNSDKEQKTDNAPQTSFFLPNFVGKFYNDNKLADE